MRKAASSTSLSSRKGEPCNARIVRPVKPSVRMRHKPRRFWLKLQRNKAAHVQAIDRAIGRSVQPTHLYLATHSGVAARLTPSEADIVRTQPGVKSVERERVYDLDTFLGPPLIGAPSIWNGSAVPGGVGTRGQGVVIAVLDSGTDPSHPSNANVASCGHGVAGAPNKLISALDCSTATGPGGLCNGPNPVDTNGHG